VSPPSNLILVGFMGVGKSTVGRLLARRLGCRFQDLDERIVAESGCCIPDIFAREGEAGFRERETAALRALRGESGWVIAAGGGAMGRDANVVLMHALGRIICLTARPEVILERTRPWQDRPMLAGAPDPLRRIEELIAARAPRYALADLTVDTSELTVEEVVEGVCRALR
jgi:shikimate kinase